MQAAENSHPLETYLAVATAQGMTHSPRRLRHYMRFLFRCLPLAGKRMLEIGGGDGRYTFYAAACGAQQVVCLEPEAAGSTHGFQQKFARTAAAIGAHNALLLPQTLQQFEAPAESFDVILMYASVNHVDEWACEHLRDDLEARRRYLDVFTKIFRLAAPGATLIISDCSSKNLFPMLGLKNPFWPSIQWQLHQTPEVWIDVLSECGFVQPKVSWATFNALGRPGQLLLGNRLAAFLTTSIFNLHVHKS